MLACLQVLGRGNFFDDIPQLSFISEQTIQRVFHEFTQRFALEFFPKHVKFPQGAHLEEILREYKDVGFGGCAGSMDCTHIHYQSAPNSGRHSYVGKEGFATVAFEVVCDHKLRCLGVSKAFPGAMNDKTIVMFDEYVRRIKTECKDVPFTLLGEDGSEFEERGLYLIVDGGYHKVSRNKLLCVHSSFYSSSMHGIVFGRPPLRRANACFVRHVSLVVGIAFPSTSLLLGCARVLMVWSLRVQENKTWNPNSFSIPSPFASFDSFVSILRVPCGVRFHCMRVVTQPPQPPQQIHEGVPFAGKASCSQAVNDARILFHPSCAMAQGLTACFPSTCLSGNTVEGAHTHTAPPPCPPPPSPQTDDARHSGGACSAPSNFP